jgi:two-component system, NarL family, sensor histidine kinase DegS
MITGDLPIYDHTDQGIRILEEERRRIARDLHDGPAQQLTNISMRLDVLKRMMKMNPDMAENEITKINSRIVATVNDIRRLIYDLRPIAIDEIGLIPAMQILCKKCQEDWGISVSVINEELLTEVLIAPAKQVSLYRLTQEILNNIKKHAQANHVTVTLSQTNDRFLITIQDDGKGFDPTHIPAGHYGLVGMKERAEYLGGALKITSVIGQGSTFFIQVIVNGNEEE